MEKKEDKQKSKLAEEKKQTLQTEIKEALVQIKKDISEIDTEKLPETEDITFDDGSLDAFVETSDISVIDSRKASIYFAETAKMDYDKLFSYLGKDQQSSDNVYFMNDDDSMNSGGSDNYGTTEILDHETVDSLAILVKVEKNLGKVSRLQGISIATGDIDIATMERHNLYMHMSAYKAMIKTKSAGGLV